MSRLPRCVRVLGHVACVTLVLSGCRSRDAQLTPDAAFTPYIPAFTAGHISARAPILVRIAEDQRWRDSSNTAIQDLFDLDPNVEGTVSWHDELTLAFQPTERLKQEETYTVNFKLGQLIELPSGMGDFKFQVTTVRQGLDVRVSDMQSLSQTDLTWQRVVVSVATSDDATGQELEACFTATQKDRTLPLTWEHEPNGLYHRFTVDSVLRGETASLLDLTWNGERIGSTDKGTLPFDVPAIGDLALISATTNSEGDQYATLLFSDPLDPAQDLNGLVGITGADDLRITVDGNKILLYPTERLSGDLQGYVSASVQNVNHRKLGKDITVDLTFEELKPAVRMVGKGTILPSSDGLLMPFEAVNLNAVEVRVVRINADNVAQFLQVNELDGERVELITNPSVAFLQERFKSTGKSISPELSHALASTMKCHSWYVQQMAHFTWEHSRKKVDQAGLAHALEMVLDANTPFYQLTCEQISLTGINVLKAIAAGETRLTSAAVMHDYRLGTPRNVQKAREILEARDVIERGKDTYAFLDPGFELWFRREFLGEVISVG